MDTLNAWTGGEFSEDFIDAVVKHFYVATYNNQVVGTGMINIETGKVDAIFVHPNHMRRGIGKSIVEFLEDIGLNSGLETLTLESTLNAAAFYRTCGLKETRSVRIFRPRAYHWTPFLWLKVSRPTTAYHRRRH